MAPMLDAVAPTIILAQGIGRLGNWFNQELHGGPTDLPWGLEIYRRVDEAGNLAPVTGVSTGEVLAVVHPTFLYELVWNLAMAVLIVAIDRKFRLGHGRVFWLYVFCYTVGRGWIEALRIDEAELVLGLRLNIWTSILVCVVSLAIFIVLSKRYPERESSPWLPGREPDDEEDGDEDGSRNSPVSAASAHSAASAPSAQSAADVGSASTPAEAVDAEDTTAATTGPETSSTADVDETDSAPGR